MMRCFLLFYNYKKQNVYEQNHNYIEQASG